MLRRPIRTGRKYLLFVFIVLAILIADQATKALVLNNIPVNRGFEVIPGFLDIVHARNPGAAFSFLANRGSTFRSLFFPFVSLAVACVILWLLITMKQYDRLLVVGYSLFFGGAIGNFIDRMRFGEVVDFLDLHIGLWHWPAFNVADSALCVGVAIFFIHQLFSRNGADVESTGRA